MENNKILEVLKTLRKKGVEFTIAHYESGYINLSAKDVLKYYEVGGFCEFWANEIGISLEDFKSYMDTRFKPVQCEAITKKGVRCTREIWLGDYDIHKFLEVRRYKGFFCPIHTKNKKDNS